MAVKARSKSTKSCVSKPNSLLRCLILLLALFTVLLHILIVLYHPEIQAYEARRRDQHDVLKAAFLLPPPTRKGGKDPSNFFQRERHTFLSYQHSKLNFSKYSDAFVFESLERYEQQYVLGSMAKIPLTAASICSAPAGSDDLEKHGGYALLTQKIRVYKSFNTKTIRILCLIENASPMRRDLSRAAALTWGFKCDGFIAFSPETISSLGMFSLPNLTVSFDGQPSTSYRHAMWKFLRKQHYFDSYDYFHFVTDDKFVIVENLEGFLVDLHEQLLSQTNDSSTPVLLGQWAPPNENSSVQSNPIRPIITGDAGYTFNRAALMRLVDHALPACQADTVDTSEVTSTGSSILSDCTIGLTGINPVDTRDAETGEQQYHSMDPDSLLHLERHADARIVKLFNFWAALPHPEDGELAVGSLTSLNSAARFSMTFGNIRFAALMARMHAILYRSCPDPLSALVVSLDYHPVVGARDANNRLGYEADPTLLRRERDHFLEGIHADHSPTNDLHATINSYASSSFNISSETTTKVCGRIGPEGNDGLLLLRRKVQVANLTHLSPRILCAVYTYGERRELARMAALTWGHKCDGFLAFSTETIEKLGFLHLIHVGKEEYNNIWQKVRSIWAYIREHYLSDFDYFHLGGDDTFLIVENLRRFLSLVDQKTKPSEPVFLGQWGEGYSKVTTVMNSVGYTLNRIALQRVVDEAFPTCRPKWASHNEAQKISECMRQVGVLPADTRDFDTGEQQYHHLDPQGVYNIGNHTRPYDVKLFRYWASLKHPSHPTKQVGPRTGLEAAGRYSVSFHEIKTPLLMLRLHAILYRTCSITSSLGKMLALN